MDFKASNIPNEAVAREVYDLVKKVLTKPKIFHNFKNGQLNVLGVEIGMIESLNFAFGGAEVINDNDIKYEFVSTDAFDDEVQLDFTGGINLDDQLEDTHEEMKKEELKEPSDQEEQIEELPTQEEPKPVESSPPPPSPPKPEEKEEKAEEPQEEKRVQEDKEEEVEELISGFVEISASNVEVEVGDEQEDEGAQERKELMPESAPQESVPFLPPKAKKEHADFGSFLSSIELIEFPRAHKEATSLISSKVLIPLFGFYLLFVALGGIFM